MRFDDQFLERVRESTSILDLIGGYVHLKKRGKDYAALCPFHQEKTASFWVSDSKQIFKCFGCGAGGDVFKFLMLMENLGFADAVVRLAERQGIALPKSGQPVSREEENKSRLFAVMEHAATFFADCLAKHGAADEARNYLNERGIAREMVETFRLGYAPSGNELLAYLKSAGIAGPVAFTCGLVVEAGPDQFRDKFRNRIMFPIRDLQGRVMAFGGRALGEGIPKYLNSPETALYHKGNHLYGLDQARERIRKVDFAILVEGYFDCVVPFQYGFRNTVASLGTSLTENQVRLLGRYTRNVVISFDPDTAGLSAALRSVDLFLAQGFRVNVLSLPEGDDPDTFVRRNGTEAYEKALKESNPFVQFALTRFMGQKKDAFSPRGKQETVSQILPYLMKIPDRIERAEYMSLVAARLQIDEQLLRMEIKRLKGKPGNITPVRASLADKLILAESNLLRAVIDENWVSLVVPLIEKELFAGLSSEPIFGKVVELRQQNASVSIRTLRKLLGESDCLDLLDTIALHASEFPLSEEAIHGSIRALEDRCINRETLSRQEAISQEQGVDLSSPQLQKWIREKEELRRKQQNQA
jgi:DNA primase